MAEFNFFSDMPSVDIPDLFHVEKTGEKFCECSLCQSKFEEGNTYIIEKSYKRNNTTKKPELIFEYALCQKCQENTRSELSEESLKSISMYYQLYVDFEDRAKKMAQSEDDDINQWISNCIITGKPISDEEEFTIGGLFYDDKLLLNAMPFALSLKAIEEMQEILSKKTKDFLDGFQNEIFPPDIREKLPDGRLILI